MKVISSYTGDNHFLSNFYPYIRHTCLKEGGSRFSSDDIIFMSDVFAKTFQTKITFETNEHFYQCMKADSQEQMIQIAEAPTPGIARGLGRKCRMRKDFPKIQEFVMKAGLCAKFTVHEDLKQKLIATFPSMLIEGNRHRGTYWGFDYNLGMGQNRLGTIQMELRTVFMNMEK